jgi:hypothetical protein
MIRLRSLEERFSYLSLRGAVGGSTFGYDRYLNQQFYNSRQWRQMRDQIIVRDEGCDLGVPGFEIYGKIIIHHMNPMTVEDLVDGDERVLNPEFLVCVTLQTHNAIHYGDASLLPKAFVERRPGDTALWNRS